MPRDNDQWIADLKVGNESAVRELRHLLVRNLGRALARRPGVTDDFIEDTVQDAVVRVLDRIDQFQGRSRFITWATSIALRVAMDTLRSARWKDTSLESLSFEGAVNANPSVDPTDSPINQAHQREMIQALRQIIDTKLTERQRLVLVAELKGMPQIEIARQFGMNRNALYKLTHDARKRLKDGLQQVGYTNEDILDIRDTGN